MEENYKGRALPQLGRIMKTETRLHLRFRFIGTSRRPRVSATEKILLQQHHFFNGGIVTGINAIVVYAG